MALLAIDPFDNFDNITSVTDAQLSQMWKGAYTATTNLRPALVEDTAGVGHRVRFRRNNQANSAYYGGYSLPIGKTVTTKAVIGVLVGCSNGSGGAVDSYIMGFERSFNQNPAVTTDALSVTSAGALNFNSLTSADGVFQHGSEQYLTIELDFVAGTIAVYVGDSGTPALSGPMTLTSLSYITFGFLRGTGPNLVELTCDHIYVLDDAPGGPTERLGIVEVKRLPLVASVESNFTPQGGAASNLAAVNKTTLTTTTYNQSGHANGVGDTFTVDTTLIADAVEVYGIGLNTLAQKDNSGDRNQALIAKNGGDKLATIRPLATSWIAEQAVFTTNPDGSSLTVAGVGAAAFGYEARA